MNQLKFILRRLYRKNILSEVKDILIDHWRSRCRGRPRPTTYHSFLKNILNLTLLCNFFHKRFALGFTKFPLDKRNSRFEFLTVLIKLSDMKCRLGVKLYTCNFITESVQFYDASTACFNLFAIKTRNSLYIRRTISSVCCNVAVLAPKRWKRLLGDSE